MKNEHNKALRFVLLLGAISLFADVTYESARSITGPYLAILGASATLVGIIVGLGELVGYGLRVVSGILTDRTRQYWAITIVGYVVNLLAVPAMAIAGRWEIAAVLIVAERLGKAIRNPARDAMLSHASHRIGRGWAFGIHEAMDQIGATLGPVIIFAVMAWKESYKFAFAILAVPALIALSLLITARLSYPQPHDLEPSFSALEKRNLPSVFWFYLIATSFIAFGFADYPLAAFHMKTNSIVADKWIPLIYAGAMVVDALSALIFGRLYDKKGLPVLMTLLALSAWSAPFIFSERLPFILSGMMLWGLGMGVQESIIRALLADIVPRNLRATGYGIFNAGFGLAWFMGSSLMGFLYERNLTALVVFSVLAQLASLPILFRVRRHLSYSR